MAAPFSSRSPSSRTASSWPGRCRDRKAIPSEITNGKIDGDKFSFDVSFNGITISHQCTVDGDRIKMTTKTDNPDFPGMELMLKRMKETPPAAPAAPASPAQPAPPSRLSQPPQ